MEKMKKIIGMLLLVAIAIGASATTVSATALGDSYSVSGIGLGWIIIGGVIAVALIAWGMQVAKKAIKPWIPVLAILFIAGLCLQFVDVAEETAEITPSTTWSVSATVDAGNVTVDDDARTIMVLYYENNSDAIINQTDSTAWVAPILNFTIAPTQTTGLVDTSLGATTLASVNNPDKEFTEDSTTYDLFQDASGEAKKDLVWTADGTDEYETHSCTVNFGSSETVLLTVTLLDDGLCICEAGDSEAVTLSIGGITYTMTVMCSGSAA